MNVLFIILAAGQGRRFGLNDNKLFYPVNGRPVLSYLLDRLQKTKAVSRIIITARPSDFPRFRKLIKEYRVTKVIGLVKGGKERYLSVFNTLKWIKRNMPVRDLIVCIHDGARLVVSEGLVTRLIHSLKNHPGIIPVMKVPDTIKELRNGSVEKTIPRDHLYSVQTPQVFPFRILFGSYQKAVHDRIRTTDDAGILEHSRYRVKAIQGEIKNRKLTYQEDTDLMFHTTTRTGIGLDVHAFVQSRKLILGNVTIPYRLGLAGHSDADALLHSIMDALHGAAGLRDIGYYYPDREKRYKNINSALLLRKTLKLIRERHYSIVNVDSVILAQEPRISPYVEKIKKRLSLLLDLDEDRISIKATTTENLGFIGRKQGIACQTIVLLERTGLA
ncbi:MAG: 2-C-methyl-D-erythritol 2,4-cyclodiphosphate synthase [bacterium]|nr:2-C-methyl-D-erythritol 2,4-cyclodiphosphate synthase [bacterium]